MGGNMKKLLVFCISILIAVFVVFTYAQAAFINTPVPDNAYIEKNGFDWAWASPISGDGSGTGIFLDLSFQSAVGWHLPTSEELALAPLVTDFVFAGANVPLGGVDPVSGATFHFPTANLTGAAANAVPYFNTEYHHGDWTDAPGSGSTYSMAWNGMGGETYSYLAEFLVVRPASVPEASTLLLLGSGLIGLFAGRKMFRQ